MEEIKETLRYFSRPRIKMAKKGSSWYCLGLDSNPYLLALTSILRSYGVLQLEKSKSELKLAYKIGSLKIGTDCRICESILSSSRQVRRNWGV